MNIFTKTTTPKGFTESLVYKGKVYVKRYEKDSFGSGENVTNNKENILRLKMYL